MINNIKIKDMSSLSPTIKTINFGRVNLIIGPKGGGKSTLFDLVANAVNYELLSTTTDALKVHNLELHSITIDNEEIFYQSLKNIKVTTKNKSNKVYDARNDVIYQDDEIKKNLSSSDSISKSKFEFAKTIVNESPGFVEVINKIKDFYTSIQNMINISDSVNYSNTFDIQNKASKLDEEFIFRLNYSMNDIENELKNTIELLENELAFHKTNVDRVERMINVIKKDSYPELSISFRDEIIEKYKLMLKELDHIKKIIDDEREKQNKKKKILKSFNYAYRVKVSELKRSKESGQSAERVVANYIYKAENHFKTMAKRIKDVNKSFEEFIKSNLTITFNKTKRADELLDMVLDGRVEIDEDLKFSLLKKVLYNAKKVQSHAINWMLVAKEKGVKTFNDDAIVTEFAKFIKDKIKLQADGVDYETMSLGQRSIYGMKHKFNLSKNKPMFLDQPEDNLDNATIASEVLKLIKDKKEQTFIVTHNANIGILTNPDKFILCSFNAFDKNQKGVEQYQEATIKRGAIDKKPVDYLEGGIEYIKSRFGIIVGEEKNE